MEDKKLISVVVPIYNEVENINDLYERTTKVLNELNNYNYEIVFFDDGSTDGTKEKIEFLCNSDEHIKAVFYSKNFGYTKSIYYSVKNSKGDCTILLHADLQNPPELIPSFIEKWEDGNDVVLGIKNKSKENRFLYFLRTIYYFVMRLVFGMDLIAHATEFELFDKSFTDVLKKTNYINPFLRSIIIEYANSMGYVYYTQDKRKNGKSKFNLNKYYDFAVCGIINMSKKLPRKVILVSLIGILLLIIEFFANFVPDAARGCLVSVSNSLIIRGTAFILLINSWLLSFVFEYLISVNNSINEKPLITEDKRINY